MKKIYSDLKISPRKESYIYEIVQANISIYATNETSGSKYIKMHTFVDFPLSL